MKRLLSLSVATPIFGKRVLVLVGMRRDRDVQSK
jgi:hypothetical protein